MGYFEYKKRRGLHFVTETHDDKVIACSVRNLPELLASVLLNKGLLDIGEEPWLMARDFCQTAERVLKVTDVVEMIKIHETTKHVLGVLDKTRLLVKGKGLTQGLEQEHNGIDRV